MDGYKYNPIDAAKGEIRLTRLLPNSFLDGVKIEIFHAGSHFSEDEKTQEKRSVAR